MDDHPVRGVQRYALDGEAARAPRPDDRARVGAAPAGAARDRPAARAPAAPRPPASDPRGRPRGAGADRRQSVRVAGDPRARHSCCSAPSTTPRARFWPCSSARRKTCMATPRCFSSVSSRTACPGPVRRSPQSARAQRPALVAAEEQLAGAKPRPTWGACCRISASGTSPPARRRPKGASSDCGATLQDRLVSELRLRGIASVEAAQAYLPEFIADFNRRFGRPPASAAPVWRRPPADLALVLELPLSPGRRPRQHGAARPPLGATARPSLLRRGSTLKSASCSMAAWWCLCTRVASVAPRRLPSRASPSSRAARPAMSAGSGGRGCAPPPPPPPPTRPTAKTHTGRHALPTHPWVIAKDRDIRRREQRTGRTFSRSSDPGHFH